MASPPGSFSSAAAYADSVVRAAAPFRWSELESSAFSRLPDLHEVVAAAGADLDRTRNGMDHARDAGWLLVLFAPLALPLLVILAVKYGETELWLSGIAGLISAAHIALRAAEWRRTRAGGPRATPQEVVLAVFEAVFAAVSAGLVAVAATMAASPWRWLLCAGLASVVAVCLVSVRVAKQAAERGVPTSRRPAFEEVVSLVAEMSEQDRAAVRDDLDLALERLAEAGVISGAQLAEAHRSPLGSLARRLWAWERSPARQTR
ncbi:hypothetical protein [Streptomyces sp. NPDC127084]|uniref:hypothetical protein n=1 Tax=Streptomyces sp. NPDC127084 TaxID=3347133 RepID=UPI00364F0520